VNHPTSRVLDRVVAGVFVVSVIYAVARVAGWTGDATPLVFVDPVLIPAIIAATAWGLWRALRRPSS